MDVSLAAAEEEDDDDMLDLNVQIASKFKKCSRASNGSKNITEKHPREFAKAVSLIPPNILDENYHVKTSSIIWRGATVVG